MATAAAFLTEVRRHLGDTEQPGGATRYGRWYATRTHQPDFATGAWCDMFLSWCGHKIGASDEVGIFAWTVAHAKWFRARGRFNRTPRRGSLVFFDWSGSRSLDAIDHIGVVEHVRANGDLVTIEGNTDNRVARRVRSMASVVGFGHPRWTTPPRQPDHLKPRKRPTHTKTPQHKPTPAPAPKPAPARRPGKQSAAKRRRLRVVVTTRLAGNVRQVYLIPGKGYSYRRGKTGRAKMTAGEAENARAWAKRRRCRTFRIVKPGEHTHLRYADGVLPPKDKQLLRTVNTVCRARKRIGFIKSGLRPLGEPGDYRRGRAGTQWYFWEAFQAGAGNTAAYPSASAPHVAGVAVDMGILSPSGEYVSIGLDRRCRRLLVAHDLVLPVGPNAVNPTGEQWHVQRRATGGTWRALPIPRRYR